MEHVRRRIGAEITWIWCQLHLRSSWSYTWNGFLGGFHVTHNQRCSIDLIDSAVILTVGSPKKVRKKLKNSDQRYGRFRRYRRSKYRVYLGYFVMHYFSGNFHTGDKCSVYLKIRDRLMHYRIANVRKKNKYIDWMMKIKSNE